MVLQAMRVDPSTPSTQDARELLNSDSDSALNSVLTGSLEFSGSTFALLSCFKCLICGVGHVAVGGTLVSSSICSLL